MIRHENAGEHAQQGALADAVSTDDAKTLAVAQLPADVLQRPMRREALTTPHPSCGADEIQPDHHVGPPAIF
ncbi:MAG: hypothetical protein AMXMBFR59_03270 [Rhodanobacteraceae bacterium]